MCLAGNVGPWFPCFLEDTASSLLCHVPLPQTRAPWESKGSWNHVVSADGALYGGCGAVCKVTCPGSSQGKQLFTSSVVSSLALISLVTPVSWDAIGLFLYTAGGMHCRNSMIITNKSRSAFPWD